MTMVTALFFAILAGIFNGSFATPINFLGSVNKAKVWFIFSFWAFLIIPITTFFFISNSFLHFIFKMPLKLVIITFGVGVFWGIGMIFLSLAFKYLGIAVTFVINIGIGTAGGTLIPLFLLGKKISSSVFYLIIIAVTCLLLGVVLAGISAYRRENSSHSFSGNKKILLLSLTTAIIAGISSSFQGISYSYSIEVCYKLFHSHNDQFIIFVLPWFFIFIGAFIPYVSYFSFLTRKLKSEEKKLSLKSNIIIILMSFMFFESTICYSKASQILGSLGSIIAWPLFMIFIIFVSNFWGYLNGEWVGVSRSIKNSMLFSILSLLVAIFLLLSSSLIA